jgi:hypothetical protein
MQDLHNADTQVAAAAAMPPSATAASSSKGMQTSHPASGLASGLLSRGFTQLRLAGPPTSTSMAVATAANACPPAAAAVPAAPADAAGVSTDNGPSGSSGGKQQQEEGEKEGGSALQLVRFTSNLPSNGRLLRALEGQTQLTALQLCLTTSGTPAAGCSAALASLTSLQSLTLSTVQKPSDSGCTLVWTLVVHWYGHVAGAFSIRSSAAPHDTTKTIVTQLDA